MFKLDYESIGGLLLG